MHSLNKTQMSTLEFNYLIGNHSGSLKSFAYNFTKNVEDAEDLLQDTLVKAIRYKDNFQDGTNFKGWLFTIMRNIFINNYKRKKLQKTINDSTDNQFYLNYGKISEDTVSVDNRKASIMDRRIPISNRICKGFADFRSFSSRKMESGTHVGQITCAKSRNK